MTLRRSRTRCRGLLATLATAALVSQVVTAIAASAVPTVDARPTPTDAPAVEVRSIYTGDWGAPRPAGVAVLPDTSTLVVGDGHQLLKITTTEDFEGRLGLPAGVVVRDLGIDPSSGRFAVEDDGELAWGHISSTASARSARFAEVGLTAPAGVTFDDAGHLLVLDAGSSSIDDLGEPTTSLDTTPTALALPAEIGDVEGLAYNPADGLTYVANVARRMLYGIDAEGVIRAAHDLAGVDIRDLAGMSFGPSADPTDDPSVTHLYVADAGDATTLGRVAEVSLTAAVAAAAPVVTAQLIRRVDTSAWVKASPDPSGVTYASNRDCLIVADSEVDETTGAGQTDTDLWETTRAGSVQRTGNTYAFTQEATGLGYDPGTATVFVSTDARNHNGIGLFRPGSDNVYGTADDVVSSFSTQTLGLTDTEDPAFDTATGDLFITDGVAREIYRIHPGNSTFGDADDTVTHFDVGVFTSGDDEGLAYNPVANTLYVGDSGTRQIAEITKTGTLIRTIDPSAITGLDHVSGLGVGPSSDDATKTSIYIVDRGVDNGSSPNENDGELFEIRAPASTSGPNTAPAVSAGPDQTITLPSSANLQGSVSDDGLPNPPATTTAQWSKVSGPGTVTFGSASSPSTTATFSQSGTYVLRLTANDSALQTTDDVTISVQPAPPTNQPPTVNAGPDQAITLPSSANLQGSVTDDGLPNPPASTSKQWSKVSGPGTVTFGNAAAPTTTASFSAPGTYVLRLTANDGALSRTDDVTIYVLAQSAGTLDVPVAVGLDDAEESSAGAVNLTSPNLQLVVDGNPQTVGIRFAALALPREATITNAYVQFRSDKATSGATSLTIRAHAADDAPTFTTASQNVSSRPRTTASVAWQPAAWTQNQAGTAQRTPNLAPVIQEVVGRAGWAPGHALALTVTGSGKRNADSFEGGFPPILHVEYTRGATNQPPTVNAGPDQTITLPASATLSGSVSDDNLPNPPASTTKQWSKVSGPGTVTFGDATAPSTTTSFSASGTYVLRLTANDGAATTTDDVTITVNPPPTNAPPTVNAGPDQTITLPASATLSGSVTDDDLPNPPASTTKQWSKVSGPGTVTFGDATAPSTTASFSASGTYVLRLTANDGAATTTDDVTIIGLPAGATLVTADVPVAAGSDDAEEASTGSVNLSAQNLKLVTVSGVPQTVGLRFAALAIPQGAVVSNAYVQFRADSTASTAVSLTIRGQASDDAPTFTTAAQNISSRTRTTASVAWSPAAWTTVGASGQAERTPNLAPVVQEIVDRAGWSNNHALALIVTGSGRRVADSFEGGGAPVLHLEYYAAQTNAAPTVDAGADQTITLPASANVQGSVVDDGLPSPPASTTKQWSTVSGPGTVTFGDATSPTTTASFSESGTYVLRLTADDGATSSHDDVQIVANSAPTVGAGTDQTITLPATASLQGSVTDDGLPNPPGSTGHQWSKTSGPGTVTFGDTSSLSTTATFSTDGTYVLELTADDGAAQRSDQVTITVQPEPPPNQAPVVDAGPDRSIDPLGTATLSGSVSDDGLPNPPGHTTAAWSKASGPGTVTFADASSPSTTATFSSAGTYVLRLSADDSGKQSSDDMTVQVGTLGNEPPNADAGPDQTVTLPAGASLDGTVTDDGLPLLASMTTGWSKASGPGTVTFADPSAVDTTASFSQSGTYVLRLTADDGELNDSDDVTITVNSAPTVDAGADQTTTLPAGATLQGTASDDGLPDPPGAVTYAWSKASGPGTVTFGNAASLSTTASFSTDGTYVLALTADDGAAQRSDQVTITVQPAAASQTLDAPIRAGSDDAEEQSTGSVLLTAQNLRLVTMAGTPQTVGLRFTSITIPRGATITNAYVQFTTSVTAATSVSLTIQGQAADDPGTFTTATNDISGRARTTASVPWSPPGWNVVGEAGQAQRTSDLAPVIRELVNRAGWSSGNAVVLIFTGSGRRVASSFEGGAPPVLHVDYTA